MSGAADDQRGANRSGGERRAGDARKSRRRPHPLDPLVGEAARGDADAFERLVSSSYSALLGGTRALMGRGSRILTDPEDVLQDAMLVAMGSLKQLRATDVAGFRAWILGIARNQVRRLRRFNREKQRPRLTTTLPPSLHTLCGGEVFDQVESSARASPEDRAFRAEAIRLFRSHAHLLQRRQYLAIVLRDSLQLSWRTVALVLDHPTEEAARQAHYRAARSLRRKKMNP